MEQRARLMWFFAVVYAVEGVGQARSGIIWQPLLWFLKEIHHWNPVQISASLAALDVPWMIKPVYGLISDFLPICGSRRRSYLIAANLLGVAAFAWLTVLSTPGSIIPVLVVTSIAMAAASSLCGALLVEGGREHGAAAFVNQQWLWFNAAVMAATLIGGALTELMSPAAALHAAAGIAAAVPLAAIGVSAWIVEPHAALNAAATRHRLRGLAKVPRSRTLWIIAAFLFCYYFSPGFGTPLYFRLSDQLGFSQGFIGVLSSANAVGWIAGGLLYRFALSRLPTTILLRLSIVLGSGATLLYLGLNGLVSAVIIYVLAGAAAMIANIATLSLAAEHCPEGAEGFTYGLLMSVLNVATPVSDTMGSLLYEYVFSARFAPLILVSAGFTLAVLPLIRFLPAQPVR